MTIRIPNEVAIGVGALFVLAFAFYAVKQAPEMMRYLKIEGM
jgi:UDP-N-acetyl-D-mannosaminuronic acid transferase (WecB/TagA/CpsF family)